MSHKISSDVLSFKSRRNCYECKCIIYIDANSYWSPIVNDTICCQPKCLFAHICKYVATACSCQHCDSMVHGLNTIQDQDKPQTLHLNIPDPHCFYCNTVSSPQSSLPWTMTSTGILSRGHGPQEDSKSYSEIENCRYICACVMCDAKYSASLLDPTKIMQWKEYSYSLALLSLRKENLIANPMFNQYLNRFQNCTFQLDQVLSGVFHVDKASFSTMLQNFEVAPSRYGSSLLSSIIFHFDASGIYYAPYKFLSDEKVDDKDDIKKKASTNLYPMFRKCLQSCIEYMDCLKAFDNASCIYIGKILNCIQQMIEYLLTTSKKEELCRPKYIIDLTIQDVSGKIEPHLYLGHILRNKYT